MNYSAIRDNHAHGAVGDFLKQAISNNSEVSNDKVMDLILTCQTPGLIMAILP